MTARILTVLGVALGAAACASSPIPPGEPPSPTPACATLARQAADRVGAVLAANRACTTDADCALVGQSASCFDHCTTAIAGAGKEALRLLVTDVDAHECQEFTAAGCRVEVPPCTPPNAAACHAGVCG